jgi:hypothetical protein
MFLTDADPVTGYRPMVLMLPSYPVFNVTKGEWRGDTRPKGEAVSRHSARLVLQRNVKVSLEQIGPADADKGWFINANGE